MAEQPLATKQRYVADGTDSQLRTLILASEVKAVPRSFYRNVSKERIKTVDRRKRFLDIALCVLGAPLLLVVFPAIALGVKLSSRGPVFFKQKRVGKDGEEFSCLKFRTMDTRQEVDEEGKPNVTQKGDDRIYPFGQFLRVSNLDELPQLINVIRGEMSLVGPRPYMKVEDQYWEEVFEEEGYELRRTVKPGISGLAQVNGYRGGILSEEHMRTRLHYDILYVKSHNTRLDLEIIFKTILHMFKFKTKAH